MPGSALSTPCIKVCVVDPVSALCIGCGRTTAEIAGWAAMNEAERKRIMGLLADRLRASRSRAGRGGRLSRRRGA